MLKITDNQIVATLPFGDVKPGSIFRIKDREGGDFNLFLKVKPAHNQSPNALSLSDYELVTVSIYDRVIPVHSAELIIN